MDAKSSIYVNLRDSRKHSEKHFWTLQLRKHFTKMRVHESDGIVHSWLATLFIWIQLTQNEYNRKIVRKLGYVFLLNEKSEYSHRLEAKASN